MLLGHIAMDGKDLQERNQKNGRKNREKLICRVEVRKRKNAGNK